MNDELEDRLDQMREARYRALGARTPCCSIEGCREVDPFALTGVLPEIVCHEHVAERAGRSWIEGHHVSAEANSPLVVPVPVNDHAALTAVQVSLWPKETLRNPDASPLLRAAAAIRGWLDILRLIIDRALGWIPAALETLDALLCERLGRRWWEDLGWHP